jgi:hypothetical protein
MKHEYEGISKWSKWVGIIGLLAVFLLASAVPGDAWRGGRGWGGGWHGHGWGGGRGLGWGTGLGTGLGLGTRMGRGNGGRHPTLPAVVAPAPLASNCLLVLL